MLVVNLLLLLIPVVTIVLSTETCISRKCPLGHFYNATSGSCVTSCYPHYGNWTTGNCTEGIVLLMSICVSHMCY